MCGRLALTTPPDAVRNYFGYGEYPNFPPRYNIAPTQPLAIVHQETNGRRRFQLARWGFIPSWAKNPASFSLIINARLETAIQKPSFKTAMRHRRCVIPASGFYEWKRSTQHKQAYWIHPSQTDVVGFAGLWETWSDPDGGEIDTCAILTCQSNDMMSAIHHRMPVVLKEENMNSWLDVANVDAREAQKLIKPLENDFFNARAISSLVNKVSNDGPEVQQKAAEEVGSQLIEKKEESARQVRNKSQQLDLF